LAALRVYHGRVLGVNVDVHPKLAVQVPELDDRVRLLRDRQSEVSKILSRNFDLLKAVGE
jgi:hypothetical protein